VFVNSAGDLRLLGPMLRAAESFAAAGAAAAAEPDPGWARATEPLFIRGLGGRA
jgi:hypothetical protein